ncbi:MAG: hypothetical protein LBJ02_11945 [Bifidobacteriaceae bacterium]|jgi:hypothetical protein|nr:hypothetical protein [Bifidobacteriaceae bacterium]
MGVTVPGTGKPKRLKLDPNDPVTVLREGVIRALLALPGYFEFGNPVSGINATDLFSLNSLLGAAIETEVVRTLNKLRNVWDPGGAWTGFRFERSSQAFPDVRLVSRSGGEPRIAIGIELKGWYLLAKEGVPSMRYQVAPAACAPHDLICVVPWHLSNAVSGTAEVIEPWVESARYAAEYRDYWWSFIRKAKSHKKGVSYPEAASPYPSKADLVSARPQEDGGGNFGRLPRASGLMDGFIDNSKLHEVLGIPVSDWVAFLQLHSDSATPDEIGLALSAEVARHTAKIAPGAAEEVFLLLQRIARLIDP